VELGIEDNLTPELSLKKAVNNLRK